MAWLRLKTSLGLGVNIHIQFTGPKGKGVLGIKRLKSHPHLTEAMTTRKEPFEMKIITSKKNPKQRLLKRQREPNFDPSITKGNYQKVHGKKVLSLKASLPYLDRM